MNIVMKIGARLVWAGILFWTAVAGAVFGFVLALWTAMEMS
jgi:hypothetical protein